MVKKQYSFYLSWPSVLMESMLVEAGHIICKIPGEANIFLFTGGPDVIPLLYGERPLSTTVFDLKRDLLEIRLYQSILRKVPKIGVCRGAQFLNVMCGGALWQHVDGHHTAHDLWDVKTKRVFRVSSAHHQMMQPPEHAKILAFGGTCFKKEGESCTETSPKDFGKYQDPEVVWFRDEKVLCFQPNPGLILICKRYFFTLLENYIFNRVQ